MKLKDYNKLEEEYKLWKEILDFLRYKTYEFDVTPEEIKDWIDICWNKVEELKKELGDG